MWKVAKEKIWNLYKIVYDYAKISKKYANYANLCKKLLICVKLDENKLVKVEL